MIMKCVKDIIGPRGFMIQKILLLLIRDEWINFFILHFVYHEKCKKKSTERWKNISSEYAEKMRECTVMAACPCGEVSGQMNIRPDGIDLF